MELPCLGWACPGFRSFAFCHARDDSELVHLDLRAESLPLRSDDVHLAGRTVGAEVQPSDLLHQLCHDRLQCGQLLSDRILPWGTAFAAGCPGIS